MSEWTHPQCEACWVAYNPDRWPVRVMDLDTAYICCFCGDPTWVGIFVREDPDSPTINRCLHDLELRLDWDGLYGHVGGDGSGRRYVVRSVTQPQRACLEYGYEFTYLDEGCDACISRKVSP